MSEMDEIRQLVESQKKEKAKTEGKLETLYEALGEDGYTSSESAKEDMVILGKKILRMKRLFKEKLYKCKKDHATELS